VDLDPEFGRALGTRIKAAKLSLGVFARRCGHSPGILTLVITGKRKPPPKPSTVPRDLWMALHPSWGARDAVDQIPDAEAPPAHRLSSVAHFRAWLA
jgi:hypothetical protein